MAKKLIQSSVGKKERERYRAEKPVRPLIEVKNLKKSFKTYERGQGLFQAIISLFRRKTKFVHAIKDISFNIEQGSIVGFLGPNGAGKSTTLKILSGVLHPTSGEVQAIGFVPWKQRKKYVAHIGVVFGQKTQLFWDLPPVDAFYMHKSIYSLEKKAFEKQLQRLVHLLEIEEIMKKPTRQLSLGERMRCEFVMAMLHKPPVIFLDEPTIGLDVIAKETIRNFIKKVNKEEGTTFIITSHDLEDIEHVCQRVIIINKGTIVFDNDVRKLKGDDRRYITITFENKIDIKLVKSIKGIIIKEKLSPYALKIVANTKKITLDTLIKKLRKGNRIEDLEVSNPPISDLIKKLYGREE